MSLENWSIDEVESQLDSGREWSGATITVAFPAFSSGMVGSDSEGELAGFRATTAAQQATMRLALQTWDDLIAPDFQFVNSNSNLEFGFSNTMSGFAHAYFPTVGSIWFSGAYTSGENNLATPRPGDYGFMTYVHEIGHALGLNHMGNYNGNGSWNPSSFQDSTVLSVMSYFGPSGPYRSSDNAQADWTNANGITRSAQTPMLNDVYVIQRMYGVSTTTRSGDTVYGFGTTITGTLSTIYDFTSNLDPILTIFDSGGNDTLDLSGWRTNSDIRLEAGYYSSGNSMTNNIAIAYNTTIENAVGGAGSDRITGNAVANRLDGGAGDDRLIGGDGNDTLAGGAGNDTCEGGAGTDTGVIDASFAACTVSYDAGRGEFRISASSSGTDLFYGVERFQFNDQLLTADQMLSGDSSAPTLASSDPKDNDTGVSTTVTLRLTFSETVEAGSGEIRILRSDGQLVEAIPVGDARVTIDGDTVTINPDAVLSAGTGYFLNITAGALKDGAGNAYAGISGNTAFNFTTSGSSADTLAPTLLDRSPADNATEVPNDAAIVLGFSESVVRGSGDITLRAADGSLLESIPVSDTARVRIDGATVTIDPNANFAPGTTYSLNIASGAFRDGAGNAFAGISGTTAYDFRTAGTAGDTTAPTLSSRSPVDGTSGVAVSAVFTLRFSEDMRAGSGEIEIRSSADGSVVQSIPVSDTRQVLIDGNVVTIDPSFDLPAGGDFFLSIPSGALRDLAGNAFAGFSSSTAWNFSTVQSDPNAGEDDFPWDTSTPGVITVDGAGLQGRIEVADDLDLFRVELQAGVTYRLDVTSSGADGLPDPYLVLYDPDVVQVGEDDDSGGGLDASLTFTPDVSGTYYLGAYDVGTGTGDYTVSAVEVDQIDDDYPDSTDTPGEVSTDGTPLFGRIDYDGDFDVVAVFLEEGVTYRLDARQSGSRPASDPTLWLYDDFAEFIIEDYNGGGGDVDASLTYTAEYTGFYYIGVDDEPGSTGSYVVTAVEVSDAIDDLPYENGIVGDLVVDGDVTGGRIDYSDDVDVFAVELRAGETYRFDMSRVAADSLSDPLLQLYDANEELLASDDDSGGGYNASLTFTAPATGTYLLAAFDYSTDTGNYSLRAVTVDDIAPELLDATPAGGDTGVATDSDIVLRFSEDVQAGIGDILIFNGNGSLARSIDIADTSQVRIDGGVVTIDPGADLTPGVGYYVIMDPGVITDSAGNDFAGIDDPEALGFETAALEVDDDFPLDANTPGVVTVNGAAATGVIDYADDGDLFRIEMVRGKTYTIDLARAGSGGLTDPYLALYAPNGDFVTFDDDSAGGGNSRIRFTALESGTFFLGVFDYGTGTGAYTLRAAAGADDFLVGKEGPDLLRGLAANDTLDGAGGIDTLEGGTGNDLLVVDDSLDVVRELSGAGTDTVQSTASFTLPENVERLKLVGNAAVNASGNAQANQITGNVAANRLAGQGGADTLTGGDGGDTLEGGLGADLLRGEAGNDTLRGGDGGDRLAGGAGRDQLQGGIGADKFLFDTALSAPGNVDTISDFTRAQGDAIQLDDDIFRALAGFTGGSLPLARFQSAPGVDVAQGKDVRVIYNSTTGALYYDPDGNGGTAAVQFAVLSGAPALTAADILIVA